MPERKIGKTPHRTIRVADDVWNPAVARARREGTDVSKVVRRSLEEYVKDEEQEEKPE